MPPRVIPVTVRLVDPASFRIRTGHPPPLPLDTEAGYGVWHLP